MKKTGWIVAAAFTLLILASQAPAGPQIIYDRWDQATAPTVAQGVKVGSSWFDSTAGVQKICRAIDATNCTQWAVVIADLGGTTMVGSNQAANLILSGPASGGAASPTFRLLDPLDIPNLAASKITSGTMATARLGSGTADATTFLRGDQTYAVPSGGGAIPSGLIAFYNAACPSTWTEVAGAQGRIIVGLPSGGTLAGTVGTAFTDLQDKSVTPTFTGDALATHLHGVGSLVAAWPAGVPTFAGSALATHLHGTGTYATSAHSGTAVADHASHTHTYTQVVNHIHGVSTILRTATTGGATTQVTNAQDTSSTADTTRKTDNPDGGVATGTTAGPSAILTHAVTQPSAHTLSGSSEAVTGGTPAGTISWPVGVPTLSGSSAAVSGGTPSGTVSAVVTSNVLAYIQYRACSKD